MNFLTRTAPAALLAFTIFAPSAHAVVVNLDDLTLNNSTLIQLGSPGYGSEGPVTLNWNPLANNDTAVLFWNGGYSGRNGGWCNSGQAIACALDLTVGSGFSLTLDSFFLGAWQNNAGRQVSRSVIDLADSATVGTDTVNPGAAGVVNQVNASSETGFRILFGPDSFYTAINDITYSYASTNTVPPVPLPAAGWLMLGAIGGLAAVRRRRKSA